MTTHTKTFSALPLEPFSSNISGLHRFWPRIAMYHQEEMVPVPDFEIVITIKSAGILDLVCSSWLALTPYIGVIAKKQKMTSYTLQPVAFNFKNNTKYYIEANARMNFDQEGVIILFVHATVLRPNGTNWFDIPMGLNSRATSDMFSVPYRGWSYLCYSTFSNSNLLT